MNATPPQSGPSGHISAAAATHHLEGRLFGGAELEALVDEGVEVSLAHAGWHFGAELSGNDRPLQGGALVGDKEPESLQSDSNVMTNPTTLYMTRKYLFIV